MSVYYYIREREMKMISIDLAAGVVTKHSKRKVAISQKKTKYYCKFFVKLQIHELCILFRW